MQTVSLRTLLLPRKTAWVPHWSFLHLTPNKQHRSKLEGPFRLFFSVYGPGFDIYEGHMAHTMFFDRRTEPGSRRDELTKRMSTQEAKVRKHQGSGDSSMLREAKSWKHQVTGATIASDLTHLASISFKKGPKSLKKETKRSQKTRPVKNTLLTGRDLTHIL